MRAFKAEDLRSFTQALFTKDSFDDFLLREAEFRTFCAFSVSGKSERDWYTEEELEEERVEEYTAWRKLRPLCFQLIRGKKIPGAFYLTFRLSPAGTEEFLQKLQQEDGIAENAGNSGGRGNAGRKSYRAVPDAERIGAFFLNLRFEAGELRCVSAAALNSFPPDRATEDAWDNRVQEFFREHGIAVAVL